MKNFLLSLLQTDTRSVEVFAALQTFSWALLTLLGQLSVTLSFGTIFQFLNPTVTAIIFILFTAGQLFATTINTNAAREFMALVSTILFSYMGTVVAVFYPGIPFVVLCVGIVSFNFLTILQIHVVAKRPK